MSIDVSSWQLTQELQKLSGWEPDAYDKFKSQTGFSLGYLLRKLPSVIDGERMHYDLYLRKWSDGTWSAYYNSDVRASLDAPDADADTPEDAACKLAIELFKQGILTNK